MLKSGIFHPQLNRVLSELRHKDMLVIGDAGLPIPKGVERVDLGWKAGSPGYLEDVYKRQGVQKAFLAAAKGLEANKEWINQLNVFPVPDGDTGTNMSMTIMAAEMCIRDREWTD